MQPRCTAPPPSFFAWLSLLPPPPTLFFQLRHVAQRAQTIVGFCAEVATVHCPHVCLFLPSVRHTGEHALHPCWYAVCMCVVCVRLASWRVVGVGELPRQGCGRAARAIRPQRAVHAQTTHTPLWNSVHMQPASPHACARCTVPAVACTVPLLCHAVRQGAGCAAPARPGTRHSEHTHPASTHTGPGDEGGDRGGMIRRARPAVRARVMERGRGSGAGNRDEAARRARRAGRPPHVPSHFPAPPAAAVLPIAPRARAVRHLRPSPRSEDRPHLAASPLFPSAG
jgi:hypothetical protein